MDTLDYALYANETTPDPDDCRAVIQNQNSVGEEQLEQEMVEEGTGLTLPQAKAYKEKFFQLVERHAARGERINVGMFSIRSSIKGVFRNGDDSFDPTRHSVVYHITPGPRLRKLERTVKPRKVKASPPMPEPHEFVDAASGEHNRTATPGGIAVVKGAYLKFDPADPAQGLFLIPAGNPTATVRVTQFTAIKPSELHFLVPALAAGEYRVEVKAILPKLKTLRSGMLADVLEVM